MLPFKFHLIKPKEKQPLSLLSPSVERPSPLHTNSLSSHKSSCASLSPLPRWGKRYRQPLTLFLCLPFTSGSLIPPQLGKPPYIHWGPRPAWGREQMGSRTGSHPGLGSWGPGPRTVSTPFAPPKVAFHSHCSLPNGQKGCQRTDQKASQTPMPEAGAGSQGPSVTMPNQHTPPTVSAQNKLPSIHPSSGSRVDGRMALITGCRVQPR